MIPAAYQQTVYGYQYLNNAQGLQAVQTALNYWYNIARGFATGPGYLPNRCWLQLQGTNNTLLVNCGGINGDGNGDYGRDYVEVALFTAIGPQIIVSGHTFNQAGGYAQGVGQWNAHEQKYPNLQDCYTYTCAAGTITISQQNPPWWGGRVFDESGNRVNISAGVTYNIVVNFHLYVDEPYANSTAPASGAYSASILDFVTKTPPKKRK